MSVVCVMFLSSCFSYAVNTPLLKSCLHSDPQPTAPLKMEKVHGGCMFNAWSHLLVLRLPPLFQDAACTNTLLVTGMSITWQSPEVKDGTMSSRALSLVESLGVDLRG